MYKSFTPKTRINTFGVPVEHLIKSSLVYLFFFFMSFSFIYFYFFYFYFFFFTSLTIKVKNVQFGERINDPLPMCPC